MILKNEAVFEVDRLQFEKAATKPYLRQTTKYEAASLATCERAFLNKFGFRALQFSRWLCTGLGFSDRFIGAFDAKIVVFASVCNGTLFG